MPRFLHLLMALAVLSTSAFAQTTPRYLSWEHALVTRSSTSKHALAKVKIFNNWTDGKHRMLVRYNVSGLGASNDFISQTYGTAFSMPSFDPSRIAERLSYHHGTLGIVQDLSADKFIAFSSETGNSGEYFSEDRKALLKRLRFDPWKKIAPELSKEEVPRLSAAQRIRLGREVRSALRPMLKDVLKMYFRPLPTPRTFAVGTEMMEARGYRMTALMNAGDEGAGANWMRMNFEWWIAPEAPGDAVARQFFGRLLTDYRELGGPTTSMWMNESLPLMWASMPQELHQAVSTLIPQVLGLDQVEAGGLIAAAMDSSAATPHIPFQLGGTPVYFAATVKQPKPKYGRCPDCGQLHVPIPGKTEWDTIRLEMKLQDRSTRVLRPAVFDAPPEYKKASLEPVLKEWDDSVEMIQSIFDRETLLSSAPVLPGEHSQRQPVYTWRALKSYTRKANALMMRAQ